MHIYALDLAVRAFFTHSVKLLNAVLQNYTLTDGILINKPRSGQTFKSQCMVEDDPGGDWYFFNAPLGLATSITCTPHLLLRNKNKH